MLTNEKNDEEENSALFSDEDFNLIKKVFLILRMPFDADLDNRRLKQRLCGRQRKNAMN